MPKCLSADFFPFLFHTYMLHYYQNGKELNGMRSILDKKKQRLAEIEKEMNDLGFALGLENGSGEWEIADRLAEGPKQNLTYTALIVRAYTTPLSLPNFPENAWCCCRTSQEWRDEKTHLVFKSSPICAQTGYSISHF